MNFALFKSQSTIDGDNRYYKNCLLFKAGNYPDKKFSADNKDLVSLVEGTKLPICFNLEHDDHTDGARQVMLCKVGQITKMWIDKDDPSIVRGEAFIPLSVDEELEVKGVSMEPLLDKTAFVGAALTYYPRVKEAALMSDETLRAIFKKVHDTPHGRSALQEIHDMSARHGAVCDKPAAEMTSKHEMTAFQAIHDITKEHGSACYGSEQHGALGSPMYGYYSTQEKAKKMKFVDALKAWFSAGYLDEYEIDPARLVNGTIVPKVDSPPPTIDPKETAEFRAIREENARLVAEAKQREADQKAAFYAVCETEVQKLVGRSITPAQKAEYVALREANPEWFDKMAANMAVLPEFAGNIKSKFNLVNASEVAAALANEDPEKANQKAVLSDTANGLKASIGAISF